jgi:hypothetical protein
MTLMTLTLSSLSLLVYARLHVGKRGKTREVKDAKVLEVMSCMHHQAKEPNLVRHSNIFRNPSPLSNGNQLRP